MKPIIVGLGNDLLSDDGIGIYAARYLMGKLKKSEADIVATALHGLALLEIFLGYKRAIVIDAVETGAFTPGTVIEWTAENLKAIPSPSPHYTGLPELIALARELELDFPEDIKILAIEIRNAHRIGLEISASIRASLGEIAGRVRSYLQQWQLSEP